MAIGFTGSRDGITTRQEEELEVLLRAHWMLFAPSPRRPSPVLHHGDCVGADETAHTVGRRLDFWVVIHPPKVDTYRAFCEGDEYRPNRDYMVRNHAIVAESEVLIACPSTATEELRSGTWATVRRARKVGKRVFLILPSGTINFL